MIHIAETFFPAIEAIMISTVQDMSQPAQFKLLIAIAKIFHMSNNLRLLPFLVEPGRLDNWVNFVVAVLSNQPADCDPLLQ
jgi:hypothetical protein